jgi:hypothetical protein
MPYRFDDISGLHVARVKNPSCLSGTRAVLGHCGHSNGQEVDMRYYAPDGTFPVEIGETGGDGLKALVEASQSGGPGSAATARLVQWITRNRAMIEQVNLQAATLKIHFGTALYLCRPLMKGIYPNGALITYAAAGMPNQAVGIWTNMPKIATSVDPHDTHWHITRLAP